MQDQTAKGWQVNDGLNAVIATQVERRGETGPAICFQPRQHVRVRIRY